MLRVLREQYPVLREQLTLYKLPLYVADPAVLFYKDIEELRAFVYPALQRLYGRRDAPGKLFPEFLLLENRLKIEEDDVGIILLRFMIQPPFFFDTLSIQEHVYQKTDFEGRGANLHANLQNNLLRPMCI